MVGLGAYLSVGYHPDCLHSCRYPVTGARLTIILKQRWQTGCVSGITAEQKPAESPPFKVNADRQNAFQELLLRI
jgi:hypothetical protein